MQDESYDNHEREKDDEGKGNSKEWIIEVEGDRAPGATVRLGSLIVDEHYSHRWTRDVSQKCHRSFMGKFEYVPNEARYTRKGKATAQ